MSTAYIGRSAGTFWEQATTVTLSHPAGTNSRDLILAVVHSYGTASGGSDSLSGDWTLISKASHEGARIALYWRLADQASQSYTARTEAGRAGRAALYVYRGPGNIGAKGSSNQFVQIASGTRRGMPTVHATAGHTVFNLIALTPLDLGNPRIDSWPRRWNVRETPDGSNTFHASDYGYGPDSDGLWQGPEGYFSTGGGWSGHYFIQNIELLPNRAPHAPTPLFPSSLSVDRDASQRFTWTFHDPDAGDSQSAYQVRFRRIGTTGWTSTGWVSSPSSHRDYPAGAFSYGDYEWQVATKDKQGFDGPFSSSAFFTSADTPTGHSLMAPANNGTIHANPTLVEWSTPDQDAYEIQVLDGEVVVAGTGIMEAPTTRAHAMPFLDTNTTRTVRLRVRHDGLWSNWASVLVTVEITPPPVPLLNIVGDDKAGTINVYALHPAAVGTEPVTESMDVWVRELGDTGEGIRLAASVDPLLAYIWYLPASGVDYEFRVRANAAGGANVYSPWTAYRASQVTDNGDSLTVMDPVFPTHDLHVTDNGDGTLSLDGPAVTYKNGTILIEEKS